MAHEARVDAPPSAMDIDGPDYDPALGAQIAIWLDGERVHWVLRYDVDAGTIERQKKDDRGRPIIEDGMSPHGGWVATEKLHGLVEVTWKDERAAA